MGYQYQINCELTADQCKTLLDYIEKLKTEFEELKASWYVLKADQRWIPFSVKMPEDGQEAFFKGPDNGNIITFHYYSHQKEWFTDHWSYWMPIPESPESEGE